MAKKNKKSKKAAVAAPAKVKVDNGVVIAGHPIRNLLISALFSIVLGGVLVGATYAYVGGASIVGTIFADYIGYIFGGLIAVAGIVLIVIYFKGKAVRGVYSYEFGVGLAAVIAGLYVALGGLLFGGEGLSMSSGAAYSVVGVIVMACGVLKVQYSMDMMRMKFKGWWLQLVLGIIGLAVGVLIILGLAYTMAANMGLGGACGVGVVLVLAGICDLVAMISVAVCNKYVKTAPEMPAEPVFDDYNAAEPYEEPAPEPVFPDEVPEDFSLDVEPEEVPAEE